MSAAAKSPSDERHFEVIVLESAPSYNGHEMAAQLAKKDIQTTVI